MRHPVFLISVGFSLGLLVMWLSIQMPKATESNDQQVPSPKAEQDSSSGHLQKQVDELRSEKRALESRFLTLTAEKLEQYWQLESETERRIALEQILGDVFLVFFTHLAIDPPAIQKRFIDQAENAAESGEAIADHSEAKASAPEPEDLESSRRPRNPSPNPEWLRAEAQLAQVSRGQEQEFLDQVAIKDLFQQLKQRQPITNMTQGVQELLGRFYGKVMFFDTKRAAWEMYIDTNGEVVDGKFKGEMEVTLSENGRQFSRSRGSGDLKDLQHLGGDSVGFLLQTGEKNFFQLYFVEERNILIGNYYYKTGLDVFEHRGRVKLDR